MDGEDAPPRISICCTLIILLCTIQILFGLQETHVIPIFWLFSGFQCCYVIPVCEGCAANESCVVAPKRCTPSAHRAPVSTMVIPYRRMCWMARVQRTPHTMQMMAQATWAKENLVPKPTGSLRRVMHKLPKLRLQPLLGV